MELTKVLRKLLREKNEMKLVQLSRATGISVQTLSNWVGGQKPRDLEQVKKVADFFGVTLNELLFDERPRPTLLLEEHADEINAGVFEVVLRKVQNGKRS